MSLVLSEKAKAVKPSSTLAITAKAKELKANGVDVVGFGAGEPDYNTPENINQAAIDAINQGFTKYTPASGTVELREAVSRKFKRFNNLDYGPNQIVISNGGKHSLKNIFDAIINPGDEVIIPAPYWLSYPEIVKLSGGVPVFVYTGAENDYKISGADIRKAVTDKTKAVVLNSPNNPTGMVYLREELEDIAAAVVECDIYCVADEMYEHLTYDGREHISIASLGSDIYKHTITCSGLSKGYAMTGWRIGYTGSSEEIAKLMGSIQSHATSNPNSIAQKAAVEALNGPQEAVMRMKEAFEKRRDAMYEKVSGMKYVKLVKPEGAFYLFIDMTEALEKEYKGEKIETTIKMAQILLDDYAVAVVPCVDFGYPKHIRLSYAISRAQIYKGLDRIEDFLNSLT